MRYFEKFLVVVAVGVLLLAVRKFVGMDAVVVSGLAVIITQGITSKHRSI